MKRGDHDTGAPMTESLTALPSLDVPARVMSVYAPGLWPMDFHAVAGSLPLPDGPALLA